MTEDSRELVITLDFKKLFALILLTIIAVVSFYTYIVALLAWDAPTHEISITWNDFWTLDNYGAPDSVFAPGDLLDVFVEANLADQYWLPPSYETFIGDISYRVILTIFDPDDAPMLCVSVSDSQPDGFPYGYKLEADMLGSFYQIPLDAVASTDYAVRVVFWSDWLPSGEAKAVQAWEYNFEVT